LFSEKKTLELLRLRDVSAGYEAKPVLKGIRLEVNRADFIGVIGPNGGGKTTLLKVILGLLSPWSGNVWYAPDLTLKGHKRIGYLPQDPGLDMQFPVRVKDVVLTGLLQPQRALLWQGKDTKAMTALARVGMQDWAEERFGNLSGGQRQKVLLARAIADQPSLLILDEPDTFTDQRFEQDLYSLLRELNEEMAIIMVSHDLGMISSHVKTIACVNGGLHYHHSNLISKEMLASYECPIDIITHGHLPHRVLGEH
jgi:zinc transport system ATP-binding protein